MSHRPFILRHPTFSLIRALLAGVLGLALARTPATAQSTTYQTEVAFPGLAFDQPLGFATAPNETDRLFVLEKPGRIQAVTGLAGTPVKRLFLDLSARVNADSEGGVLGLAFHPAFATNRYFYVFYTTNTTTSAGTGLHDRLSRFTALSATATNADILATEVPLISQFDEASNHNGGDIHFGTDGYLYVALGDEGGANDQYNNSQRIDRDFFSGILRIDVDQRSVNQLPNMHPSVHAGTYRVPADNPFIGATSFNGAAVSSTAVRTEFWAVGLRNPWRFSFDGPTGQLFAADVGQGAREEIDLITRGGNYGWNYREGLVAGPRSGPPAAARFTDPIWDADRNQAGSIIGGLVYRGSRLPGLAGRYIFGDYVKNRIFAMTLPVGGAVQVETLLDLDTPVAFGTDPRNGDVLIASIGTSAVRRLVAAAPPPPPPADPSPPPPTPPPSDPTPPPSTPPPATPTPPPATPSPPAAPSPPPAAPPPAPTGASGGGGAVSPGFVAVLGLLALLRRRAISRAKAAGAGHGHGESGAP